MLVVVCPSPMLQFVDKNGAPLVGGQLFTYLGGTESKVPTFTDSTGNTQNTNPIVLNLLGEPPAGIFVEPSTNIKFVLAPATDTDPPTNPIWTVDNVAAPTTSAGTMALQDANNVNISGGVINSVSRLVVSGGTTLSTLTASGNVVLNGNVLTVAGNSTFGGTSVFSGVVTINANLNVNANLLTLGSTTGSSFLAIQALSTGFLAAILLQTGNSSRWAIHKSSTAESGSNTGSDFNLDAYSDAGALNFTAIAVNRASGLVTLGSLLINTSGGLTLSNQMNGAASGTGTLTNSPVAGNPPFWIPAMVNGVAGWIPFWHA